MKAFDEPPSVTRPSSTIHTSPAPASAAACLASTWAIIATVLMSRRFQRRSGTVITSIPLRALGLSATGRACVNKTSDGFGSSGKAKSRSPGPRVICR